MAKQWIGTLKVGTNAVPTPSDTISGKSECFDFQISGILERFRHPTPMNDRHEP